MLAIGGSGFDWHDLDVYLRPDAIGYGSFDKDNNIVFNMRNSFYDAVIMLDCSQCPIHPQLRCAAMWTTKKRARYERRGLRHESDLTDEGMRLLSLPAAGTQRVTPRSRQRHSVRARRRLPVAATAKEFSTQEHDARRLCRDFNAPAYSPQFTMRSMRRCGV
jgi:hypothetical protein